MTDTLPTLTGKSAAQVEFATRRQLELLRMVNEIDHVGRTRADLSGMRNALAQWILSHESAAWHLDELDAIKQVTDWGWKLAQILHTVTVDELIARGRAVYSRPAAARWRERQTDDDTMTAGLADLVCSAECVMSNEPIWVRHRTRREGFAVLLAATKKHLNI